MTDNNALIIDYSVYNVALAETNPCTKRQLNPSTHFTTISARGVQKTGNLFGFGFIKTEPSENLTSIRRIL